MPAQTSTTVMPIRIKTPRRPKDLARSVPAATVALLYLMLRRLLEPADEGSRLYQIVSEILPNGAPLLLRRDRCGSFPPRAPRPPSRQSACGTSAPPPAARPPG